VSNGIVIPKGMAIYFFDRKALIVSASTLVLLQHLSRNNHHDKLIYPSG